MASTGKIFSDSSNIYQDQARLLFNYYEQSRRTDRKAGRSYRKANQRPRSLPSGNRNQEKRHLEMVPHHHRFLHVLHP